MLISRFFKKTDRGFDLPQSTFEPTQKEANVSNINTIPGHDVFYLDCRVLPEYPLSTVIDAIKSIAVEVEQKNRTGHQNRSDQFPSGPTSNEGRCPCGSDLTRGGPGRIS